MWCKLEETAVQRPCKWPKEQYSLSLYSWGWEKVKLNGRAEKNGRVKEKGTAVTYCRNHMENVQPKLRQYSVEKTVENGRSPKEWRERRMRQALYDGHRLRKFGQQGQQTWRDSQNNLRINELLRNDGDVTAQDSSEDATRKSWRRKREKNTVNCRADRNTLTPGKIFSYRHYIGATENNKETSSRQHGLEKKKRKKVWIHSDVLL